MENAQKELDTVYEDQGKRKGETFYHLVTFNLLEEEFGVEISSVQEIIRAANITPVPGAPSHVRGVINLRGKIIPVVDLRRRFSLPEAENSENQRIVVVEFGPKRIGMLVDSVSQVIKVPLGVVEEMPEEAINVDENYIKGVGKLDSRLIIILDLNKSLLLT
ncbi:MAG: chemotaxis protein CheW [Desulfuromonadales bacterium]|nr:chemotaxis protein CheW [Desulfuromonadales bacterium]